MNRYIAFVLKRPVMVLVFFFLVTVFLGTGITRLQFDTSIATFMPKTDPEYQFYQGAKEIYGDCDTFVILSITHQDLWTHSTFQHIDDLLTDMEEFIRFDAALENYRMNWLEKRLAGPPMRSDIIRRSFAEDPAFQRLINRKMNVLGIEDGVLGDRKKQNLIAAVAAARDLKSREMIDEIISPLTIKDISGQDDMLETYRLVESNGKDGRRIPRTPAEFTALIEKLHRNPVFKGGIFATDAQGSITDLGMIVRFKDVADSDPIAREILEIVDSHPELSITPQGEPIVYIWINNYMRQDLIRLVPLVMLVAIIIFYLNFKSLRGVVLPTLTLSMATVWILGLMGLLGFKITTVGISIPILMIAVGSSYGIHILNQYYADHDLITREGKANGLLHAMEHISTTVLLAGFTTMVSFLTLATHPLSALREWGFFSGIGIVLAVWISASIIPAGLLLMPHPKDQEIARQSKPKHSHFNDWLIKWATVLSIQHYKVVLIVVGLVMAGSIAGLMRLNVETELLSYFKSDNEIRTSAREISDKYGGRWGFNILIDSGRPDGVKNREFLEAVSNLRQWLTCPENADLCVGRTDGFSDFIQTMHMAMNNDDPSFFKIPDTTEEIHDYLEIYSDEDINSDGRVDSFEPFVCPRFQTCNVLTRLGQDGDGLLGTASLKTIFTKIARHLDQSLPPGYSYKITGHPRMVITSVDYIVNGQVQSLLSSLAIVGLVVLVVFRRMKVALLSMIPMSVAVLFNFGVMGWLGIKLDIATSIIAAITIGIGVDDTIHFLNTFRKFHKEEGDIDQAIQKTLQVSGKSIIFTSMALIFGFSVLVLSTFKPLILFGLLMDVTMVATTIGALLVLPSAIKFTKISLANPEEKPATAASKVLVPVLAKKN